MSNVCLSAWGFRHRDEKIEEDLSKLYDNRGHNSKSSSKDEGHRSTKGQGEEEEEEGEPLFDLAFSGNVTAVLGKPAMLNCRVKDVGNKTVSRRQE